MNIPGNVAADDRKEIERLLRAIYPDEQAANDWLAKANGVFRKSPNDLLRDDAEPGLERVLSYLKQCRTRDQ